MFNLGHKLFLKHFKTSIPAKNLQELFDFIIRQIELSIREIGYGDTAINKNMKFTKDHEKAMPIVP